MQAAIQEMFNLACCGDSSGADCVAPTISLTSLNVDGDLVMLYDAGLGDFPWYCRFLILGTEPFSIENITGLSVVFPAYSNIFVSGNLGIIKASGLPIPGTYPVGFDIINACGRLNYNGNIVIAYV